MKTPGKLPRESGTPRIIYAFMNSAAGLADIWKREEAFRIEIFFLAISIPTAILIASTAGQVLLLIGSILLLIVVEILNTAIEAVIDRIGPETHELSRIAKDLGSAAVLLSSLFPIAVWGLIVLGALGLISV